MIAMDKKSVFDAALHVQNAIWVEIIFQVQESPNIAAEGMSAIGRQDRIIKTRLIVNSLPRSILPVEVPGASFAGFTLHRVTPPLFQRMQGYDVGRIIPLRKPAMENPVRKTHGCVEIHKVVLRCVLANVLGEPPCKFRFSKTPLHLFVSDEVLAKKKIHLMPQSPEFSPHVIQDGGSTAFHSSRRPRRHQDLHSCSCAICLLTRTDLVF